MDKTLGDLLAIYDTLAIARDKIEEQTGVNIPYGTLSHWKNGRFDLDTIERVLAIQEFFHLTNDELVEIMRNTKNQTHSSR